MVFKLATERRRAEERDHLAWLFTRLLAGAGRTDNRTSHPGRCRPAVMSERRGVHARTGRLKSRCAGSEGAAFNCESAPVFLRIGCALLPSTTFDNGTAEYDQGQALLTHLELHRQCAAAGGRRACEAELESDAGNTDARYHLGCCAAVEGDYDTALSHWFEIVEHNGAYRNGAAKDAMVSVFHLLGRNHPVVGDYPQRLYRALY